MVREEEEVGIELEMKGESKLFYRFRGGEVDE